MTNFIKKESAHYDFFFFPDSLAEKEIDKIIKIQESAYAKILEFLGVENNRKINYFLYPSNTVKGKIMGDDGNGNADPKKFEVHAVYNEDVKCIGPHEDTHLLAIPLGLPPQLFREGLAEYMSEKWDSRSHAQWASQFLSEGKLPNLEQIIDDEEWYECDDLVAYPSAGSFVTFLTTKIGKEKFLDLYKALSRDFTPEKNKDILKKITGSSISELQKEWEILLKR
jgi:hypothetical protein